MRPTPVHGAAARAVVGMTHVTPSTLLSTNRADRRRRQGLRHPSRLDPVADRRVWCDVATPTERRAPPPELARSTARTSRCTRSGGGTRELGRSEAAARRLGRSSAYTRSDAAEHRQVGRAAEDLTMLRCIATRCGRRPTEPRVGGRRSPGVSCAAGAGGAGGGSAARGALVRAGVDVRRTRALRTTRCGWRQPDARGAARGKCAAGSDGARCVRREVGRVARAAQVQQRRTEARLMPASAARHLHARMLTFAMQQRAGAVAAASERLVISTQAVRLQPNRRTACPRKVRNIRRSTSS